MMHDALNASAKRSQKLQPITVIRAGETIRVTAIARHRNGVSGSPFYVVLFTATGYGRGLKFIATLFDSNTPESGLCAVLERGLLHQNNIAFGENSWRGDNFEPALREAISVWESRRTL